MEIHWNKYEDSKPVKNGVYLIANEDIDPPLRACSYYDMIHGWTGIAHTLEKLIQCWADFPATQSFTDRAKIQSCSISNQ